MLRQTLFVPEIRIFGEAMGKSSSVFADKIRVKEKRWTANEHKLGLGHIRVCNPSPQNGVCACCMFDIGAQCDIIRVLESVVFVAH